MTDATKSIPRAPVSAPVTAVVLVAGAVVAVAANAVIAFSAVAAGASTDFHPVAFVYIPFTVVGYFAAYLGWRTIRARSARPAAVLRVLVPVLTILSFIPDVAVLATGFIPGTSATAVIALALMHPVVVAVAVPVFLRVAPVR